MAKKNSKKGDDAHKKSWRERYASMAEIEQFLSDHMFLRRNLVKGCVECRVPSDYGLDGTGWERLSDYRVNSLWRRYKHDKDVLTHDLRQVMESDFVPDFHPMRYYLDHLPPWDGLNHILVLSTTVSVRGGAALVCYEELDTMTPRDLNELKSAVTMPSVDERRPYGHYAEHYEHIASFCGTGNNVQFLSDPTGNRRWLPFQVECIDSPRDHPIDYDGVYAEAYALFRQGFQYWFSISEMKQQAEHNRQFEVPDMLSELVCRHFRRPEGDVQGQFLTAAEIFQMLNANPMLRLNPNQMGRVMTQLGFERTRYKGLRGYRVVVKNGDEIRAEKSLMAYDAEPDPG